MCIYREQIAIKSLKHEKNSSYIYLHTEPISRAEDLTKQKMFILHQVVRQGQSL